MPAKVETLDILLNRYPCTEELKCEKTFVQEISSNAVCDGDGGWVMGSLIEKIDCSDAGNSFSSESEDKGMSSSSCADDVESSSSVVDSARIEIEETCTEVAHAMAWSRVM